MFDMIAFDADDTLWHNEGLFTQTQEKFRRLLLPYHDTEWIDKKLYETEIRNLARFGYGIKGFTLSMIETAIELTEGRIQGSEIQKILDAAKIMHDAPAECLPNVADTLHDLSHTYHLMIITKGDLFDQETKVARSGLGDFFQHVEVVSEKKVANYRTILERYELVPERFLMVGNSMKSDILPLLELGAHTVHIPYETTWVHEMVDPNDVDHHYHELKNISELPALIKSLS